MTSTREIKVDKKEGGGCAPSGTMEGDIVYTLYYPCSLRIFPRPFHHVGLVSQKLCVPW